MQKQKENRVLIGLFGLVLFFFCSEILPALAAAPEICGDGIDDSLMTGGAASGTWGSCPTNYHNAIQGTGAESTWGCDADCDAPDKDNDGYNSDGTAGWMGSTAKDCDDTRSDVYPGVYVPNSFVVGAVTGYKLCQTDGTYGSTVLTSTTPLCESPNGTSHCFYIDPTSGSDTTGNGSYSLPWKTFGMVSGGVSGVPAGAHTLAPDDFVYGIGSGTASTTFTSGDGTQVFEGSVTGTVGHPITVKRYPGASMKIDGGTHSAIQLVLGAGVNYYNFDDLDATSSEKIFNFNGSSHLLLTRIYAHDMAANGDNNGACVSFQHGTNNRIFNSFLRDCDWGSGNIDNISGLMWLDNEGETPPAGADHQGSGNTIWCSAFNASLCAMCAREKHGVTLTEAGTNGHIFSYNTCLNFSFLGVKWSSAGLRFTHNRMWSDPTAIYLGFAVETGTPGANAHEDEQVQYNTFVQGAGISWNFPYYLPPEHLKFDHNIFVAANNPPSHNNSEGTWSIDGYGGDADKATFESNAYLAADLNCYYSPNAVANFYYYGQSAACRNTPCANGGDYTFAQWQSIVGQDSHSLLQNPNISAPKFQASGGCAAYGASVSTTTTSTSSTITTSTTTTTTLPAYQGPTTGFKRWFGGRF